MIVCWWQQRFESIVWWSWYKLMVKPYQLPHLCNNITHSFYTYFWVLHWNKNVFILMKSSSLAAPKVVKMTTFGAASDENFIKMMTFSFQWIVTIGTLNTKPLRLKTNMRIQSIGTRSCTSHGIYIYIYIFREQTTNVVRICYHWCVAHLLLDAISRKIINSLRPSDASMRH